MSYHDDRRQPKPRKVSRLKQCNKSNRLLRRFYSGRISTPQSTSLAKQLVHGETIY